MKTNQIICGDNVKTLQTFPDECIDLTVTSPPYDGMRDYEGYDFDFENLCLELYRVTKPGGVCVWVVGDQTKDGDESGSSFRQALYFKAIGWKLHDTMIYEKDCFANPSSNRYHQIFEYMFVFVKDKLKTFNPIKDKENKCENTFGKNRRKKDGTMPTAKIGRITLNQYGTRYNIWKYNTAYGCNTKDKIAYTHPAIFPEKLAEDHIKSWSNPGDLILDPFSGSGTTAKMAWLNHRDFIGIDCSEKYCAIARKRVAIPRMELTQYKKQKKQKITTLF